MNPPVHAGFDGLVWVVIVVIAIVSELVKNARRMGNKPPGKPDDGTWGLPTAPDARSLDKRIEDYIKQLGQPPQAAGQPKPPVHVAPPPMPARSVSPPPSRVLPRHSRRAPAVAAVRPKPAAPKRAAAVIAPPPLQPAPALVRVAAPAPAPRPAAPAAPQSGRMRALREALRADLREGASLQQAVLLAEIIGPPRALRPLRGP